MMRAAAVGLTVSAGRAVVVVLRGTRRSPEIVVRYEITLHDPWQPESLHPYHLELGGGLEAELGRMRGCNAAEKAAQRAARALVEDMRSHGLEPQGAAIVVASLAEPTRVRAAHPRAHAAERKLYRDAVGGALAACGVPVTVLDGGSVRRTVAERLARTPRDLDAMLWTFAREVGTPWRAPEKQAALGAWLALPRRGEPDAA